MIKVKIMFDFTDKVTGKHYKKGTVVKWCAFVQYRGYIPRCMNPKCLGRSDLMFHTEAEAAEAWNRRSGDV
jgi:hypothetical protein